MKGLPLEKTLRAARGGGRKLLVPYVTGGMRADWVAILLAMADAGADAIEVGLPFSDPMMDGPTIQEASLRALERGTTPPSVMGELRDLDAPVPLVVMTPGEQGGEDPGPNRTRQGSHPRRDHEGGRWAGA